MRTQNPNHIWKSKGGESRQVQAYMPTGIKTRYIRLGHKVKWVLLDAFSNAIDSGEARNVTAARTQARAAKQAIA